MWLRTVATAGGDVQPVAGAAPRVPGEVQPVVKPSGLLLEAKAEKKWGGQPDYEAYKATTPVLIPKLFV